MTSKFLKVKGYFHSGLFDILRVVSDASYYEYTYFVLLKLKVGFKGSNLHGSVILLTRTFSKVKSMQQKSGTEAIRTQIQPSKPKREITENINSQIN